MAIPSLKAFRRSHRIQLQELALESHVAPSTLSRLENGWITLTSSTASRLELGYRKLQINAQTILSQLLSEADQKDTG